MWERCEFEVVIDVFYVEVVGDKDVVHVVKAQVVKGLADVGPFEVVNIVEVLNL